MGFFPSLTPAKPPPTDSAQESATSEPGETQTVETVSAPALDGASDGPSSLPPTMKAALLTGDYAMQNVAIQIGLNVFGVGGKRIRDVKTWVLRCYGCFK